MLKRFKKELDQLSRAGQLRSLSERILREGAEIEYRSRRVADFTNFDYLSLNSDKRLRFDVQSEIALNGISAGASRLISGNLQTHGRAERRIAQFFGTESALLFSTRTQAVFSLLTCIATERDIVLYDELSRSPVADAAYLVNATALPITFDMPEQLEEELEKSKHYSKIILFVESLSSVTGRVLDLTRFIPLFRRYSVNLVVDETYALGVVGLRGSGLCDLLPPDLPPLAIVASFAEGASSFGAAVAGSSILTSFLLNRSRTFTTEIALPSPLARGIESSIDILELGTGSRDKLSALSLRVRNLLRPLPLRIASDSTSPIVSLEFSRGSLAIEFVEALIARGFLLEVVPRGTLLDGSAFARMILTVSHTEKQIEGLLQAISDITTRIS